MKMEKIDLVELFDSYMALRELEDKSNCFGNVDYFISIMDLPTDIVKLFEYVFDNYVVNNKVDE